MQVTREVVRECCNKWLIKAFADTFQLITNNTDINMLDISPQSNIYAAREDKWKKEHKEWYPKKIRTENKSYWRKVDSHPGNRFTALACL